jgi:hypothetical protein
MPAAIITRTRKFTRSSCFSSCLLDSNVFLRYLFHSFCELINVKRLYSRLKQRKIVLCSPALRHSSVWQVVNDVWKENNIFFWGYIFTLKTVALYLYENLVLSHHTSRCHNSEDHNMKMRELSLVMSNKTDSFLQDLLPFTYCPVLSQKHDVSETAFYLRLQVEPTHMGPLERDSLCLWTPRKNPVPETSCF